MKPTQLSRERIWEEWRKALTAEATRSQWWQLILRFDLVQHLIPIADTAAADELAAAFAVQQTMDASTAQA